MAEQLAERLARVLEDTFSGGPDNWDTQGADPNWPECVHAVLAEIKAALKDALRMPTNSEIMLAAGEFTKAGELRAAKAVLAWRLRVISAALAEKDKAHG